MKIAKKKVNFQTPLVNLIINLEGPLGKILKIGEYIVVKPPGDNDSGSYEISLPYYKEKIPEEWLVWKDEVLKALDGQDISTGPLSYMFTDRLLIGDAKATFDHAPLDIGICTVDNFNKVLLKMTIHIFPAYTFCKEKRYKRRRLAKPSSMKLRSFISRHQELNAHLGEVPPDAEGQEHMSLPSDEIMDIIYHSMPTTWKNKIIEQGFNYADSVVKEMTDSFESSETAKKSKTRKSPRKGSEQTPTPVF